MYEHILKSYWRPSIAWLYFVTVLFDFVLAPIGYSILQTFHGVSLEQWEPLTLKGAGLFHISMLTIVGVTAYGRTKEKLQAIAGDIKMPSIVKED